MKDIFFQGKIKEASWKCSVHDSLRAPMDSWNRNTLSHDRETARSKGLSHILYSPETKLIGLRQKIVLKRKVTKTSAIANVYHPQNVKVYASFFLEKFPGLFCHKIPFVSKQT